MKTIRIQIRLIATTKREKSFKNGTRNGKKKIIILVNILLKYMQIQKGFKSADGDKYSGYLIRNVKKVFENLQIVEKNELVNLKLVKKLRKEMFMT